ncbi:Kinesin-like protein [Klebsormidium nitens]|uniref:Kinesin-like protein n=1 Tax=Klebsormidium nitens TaxID=105231 RepID=A0A1Y1IMW7_KLENI|nr:Kinesin-like protein [Klebsormidium nitens]|eukprot:GAQ90501.1 Kinesin-like protein [Klebsormidium nitens]
MAAAPAESELDPAGPHAAAHIAVVVRVRPPVGPAERDEKLAVTCTDGRIQVCWQRERLKDPLYQDATTALTRPTTTAKHFDFGACLDGDAGQAAVYAACQMSALVKEALAGYAVTTFAFGQTGAGKTHSLLGTSRTMPEGGSWPAGTPEPGATSGAAVSGSEDGLLPRALHEAYAQMKSGQAEGGVQYNPSMSIMEIYNEKVVDLLASAKSEPLPVRHSSSRGFYADGLLLLPCPTIQDAVKALRRGLARRSVRAQQMNACSSRSHCLVTLHIPTSAPPGQLNGSAPGPRRQGRLCFVDLAGSERLKYSGSAGPSLQETGNINRSLFTLGKVLAALSSKGRDGQPHRRSSFSGFVPYRDSKLTQLLGDGLSGRGRTLMLACCSPTAASAEETLQTLQYASMALHVRAAPVVVLDPADQMLADLRSTIRSLKQENEHLHEQLQLLKAAGPLATPPDGDPQEPPSAPAGATAANVAERRTSERQASTSGTPSMSSTPGGSSPKRTDQPGLTSQNGSRRYAREPSPPSRSKPRPLRPAGRSGSSRKGGDGGWLESTYGQPARRRPQQELPLARFPQLAALEKDFQETLRQAQAAGGTAGGHGDVALSLGREETQHKERQARAAQAARPAPGSRRDTSPVKHRREKQEGGSRLRGARGGNVRRGEPARPGGHAESSPSPEPLPFLADGRRSPRAAAWSAVLDEGGGAVQAEPKAEEFAARNPWFGRDSAMTLAAYAAHDHLVERGLDPASDDYYAGIEQAVRQQFPGYFAFDERGAAAANGPHTRHRPRSKMHSACPTVRHASPARPGASDEAEPAALPHEKGDPAGWPGASGAESERGSASSSSLPSSARSSPAPRASPHPLESLDNLADVFRRERQAIVESLQKAQHAAEIEKETILAQIQEALRRQTKPKQGWI